jgi:predicted DNA-binding transcriptional regulator YafY
MVDSRKQQRSKALQRHLTLLLQLMACPRGMTLVEVQRAMSMPKATFHRYLKAFRQAEIDVDRCMVDGQVRYALAAHVLQTYSVTAEQLDALRIARRSVSALEGTHVTRSLDALIKVGARRAAVPPSRVRTDRGRTTAPDILGDIDRAFSSNRRVVLRYRGERDTVAKPRTVDPLLVRHASGHTYLHAFDVERGATRTFKVDRIRSVEVTRVRAQRHEFDEQVFTSSVKAWVGDTLTVVVRLSPRVARIAHEYRLVDDQTLTETDNGGAVLRATVNGVAEAKRWVLSWGGDAEALEPESLRAAVADELRAAVAQYVSRATEGPRAKPPAKVAAKKSRPARSTRLTDRETAAE